MRFSLIGESEVWFQWECPNSIPYKMIIFFIVFCWQLPTLQCGADKVILNWKPTSVLGIECAYQRYQIHGHIGKCGRYSEFCTYARFRSAVHAQKWCIRIFYITWPIGLKFALKLSGIIPNLYQKFEQNRWSSILSCVDLAWNDPYAKKRVVSDFILALQNLRLWNAHTTVDFCLDCSFLPACEH